MQTIGMPISSTPKGANFVRACIALAYAKGIPNLAEKYALQRWRPGDAEMVVGVLKAAVGAGTTTDSNFASSLVYQVSGEFSALLRNGSIIGRINPRAVPLNTSYPRQSSPSTASWLGEGAAAGASKLGFTRQTLGIAKLSAIIILSDSLVKFESAGAEQFIQNDLIKTATDFLNVQFISPAIIPVANVSPGSITNGITAVQSTGSTATQIAADLATLATTLADANEVDQLYWVMTRSDAVRLALKRDTNGAPAFPGVTINGGVLAGIPVVTSNSVPHSVSAGSIVVLVNSAGIDYGDLGWAIDASGQGSIEMDSAPSSNSATPVASTQVSLFETNSTALKLTQYVNYARTRSTSVAVLDNCHW